MVCVKAWNFRYNNIDIKHIKYFLNWYDKLDVCRNRRNKDMGLDMSLFAMNKRFQEDEFENVNRARKFDRRRMEEFLKDVKVFDSKSDYKEAGVAEYFAKYAPFSVREIMTFEPITMEEYQNLTEESLNLKGVLPDEFIDYGFIEHDEDCLEKPYTWYLERIDFGKREIFKEYMDGLNEVVRDVEKDLESIADYKDELDGLEVKELAYWRKHSDLNGYFEELYHSRGGNKEFNCQELYLTKEDIEEIVELHKQHLDKEDEFFFPEERGFFWGESDDSDWKQSLTDFERVLNEVDWDKETVYYSCWW
jgi:hypothetical protein